MALNYKVIIPARFESSRFPGKPLVKINGIPMIERVWKKCIQAIPEKDVHIATDSEVIYDYCSDNSMNVIMTPVCLTGSDRVYQASLILDADIFINVQGDEPFFNPVDLKKLLKNVLNNPSKIYNGYTKIDKINLFESSSIPKVVFDNNGNLLYMSRGKIPSNKKHKFESGWRQVCAYAFPRKDLIKFKKFAKKTQLEKIEDIEILRFLEMGKKIKMVKMSNKSISIDTKKDLKKANSNSFNSK